LPKVSKDFVNLAFMSDIFIEFVNIFVDAYFGAYTGFIFFSICFADSYNF
jgi:hypothetical protein